MINLEKCSLLKLKAEVVSHANVFRDYLQTRVFADVAISLGMESLQLTCL